MSDESMDNVISEFEGVDATLDWDNVEDAAPSLEEALLESDDNGESLESEWDSVGESNGEDIEGNDKVAQASGDDNAKELKGDSEEEGKDEQKADADKGEEADSEEVEAKEESKAISIEDLPDDTMVKVKVDGELQEISLKEYKNGISGEIATAKRFNEVNQERNSLQTEVNEINEYVADLAETMKTKSVLGGVEKIGEFVNMPPHIIREALIKELLPEIERRYGMDEKELALEFQQKENAYLKEKSESDNQRLKQEQAKAELEGKILGLREAHGISSKEWSDIEQTLLGEVEKEKVTPELIVKYNTFAKAENRAKSIVDSLSEKYVTNDAVLDVVIDEILRDPNYDDEFYKSIMSETLELAQKEEAEEAVAKTTESKKVVAKPVKKEIEEEEYLDWDDVN